MRTVIVMTLAASAVAATVRSGEPGIRRVETVGATNLVAPVSTPYVAPGQTKEYSFYGPWLDWTSTVTLDGIPQTIVEKKALFNADGALLRVKLTAPPGTSRGARDLVVRIGCPPVPFTDCSNVSLTRKAMVLRVGSVTAIGPSSGIPASQVLPFNVTGTGLDVAALHFRTTIKPTAAPPVRSAGTFVFTGTPTCGMNVVILRDQAEGGDVYPYTGVLNVHTTTVCGYRAPTPVSSGGSCPSGQTYNATTKTCS
jgi:hypothetical protein